MKGATRKWIILFFTILPLVYSFTPQEAKVNQKKIERERARQYKKAQKAFNQALKRHKQIQTKATRERMKQTKKEAPKVTPIGH